MRNPKEVKSLLSNMEDAMLKEVDIHKEIIEKVHDDQKIAANNLIHYLTLRSVDIRKLQDDLHMMGLSSLASSESHIRSQLQAIHKILGKKYLSEQKEICDYEWSIQNRGLKSAQLFGEKDSSALPSLMITFDGSFADDYTLIKKLLINGMTIARINCAHDNEEVWGKMIKKLKKACHKTGKSCKIYMDLAGPKFRTQLLCQGHHKGKAVVKEGQIIYLANQIGKFTKEDVVIHPGENKVIDYLKVGHRIYIDDGMIRGVVIKVKNDIAEVKIVRISSLKKVIKNEKGINFPDSEIDIASLTEYDIACLPFVCNYADIVGYSFVRHASDVKNLQTFLHQVSETPPHMVIKVETAQAVKYLPEIIFEGMKQNVFGIMIARGDLAVEIGFERLSEIQEEILWICDAAHVPVIWATQVLESLNKSGLATRSELTDAVLAAQAECVMLNKGSHTLEAMETLKDILKRQSFHRSKKRFVFRPLNIAKEFVSGQY